MQTTPSIDCCSAVKLGFQNYAKCSGRARRSEFWFFYLFVILMIFVTYIFVSIIVANTSYSRSNSRYDSPVLEFAFIIFFIILIVVYIPMISVTVRRLHDTGRSGFFILLYFIPFGGFILLYLCCIDSEERPNEYGPSPKYILPLNQTINPISPYLQQNYDAVPVSPYPQPVAQPVPAYPQPNPVSPQPYMAPPQGPYPQQYPPGNPYPQ